METKRQAQVAELIKRNFSLVLQQDGINIYGNEVLVTVTNVKMSPDLSLARIYISVFGTENKQEPILLLREELVRLRQALAHRVRKLMKSVPEITLFLDDTIDEMYRIDGMMQRLETDGQMGNPDEDDETWKKDYKE